MAGISKSRPRWTMLAHLHALKRTASDRKLTLRVLHTGLDRGCSMSPSLVADGPLVHMSAEISCL
eukprot:scaffold204551_cov20-Prasinocladus_malaysianus.AAC.1